MDKKYLTLSKLHKSRRIWWIKSVQTLRKWVEADKDQNDLLKTIVVGDGHTKRYYFLPEHVDEYVKSFTNGKKVK